VVVKTRRAQKPPRPALRPRRRSHARPISRVCLDLHHTDPDRPCPYCDPDPTTDDVIGRAIRAHADIAAEDAEAWGWVA
jgi:hypothetical protein